MTIKGREHPVLKECPCNTHNSLRAARGTNDGAGPRPKCICPHSLALLAVAKEEQRIREAGRMHRVHREAKDPRVRLQPPAPEPVTKRSPNFSEGLCATPRGMAAADQGMNDQASLSGIAARRLAKNWCANCPMLAVCEEWVTTQESPPGSWGGVWGGMDPWNRKGLELIIRDGKAEVIPYVHA